MILKVLILPTGIVLGVLIASYILIRWIRRPKVVIPDENCENLDPELKRMGYRCACDKCSGRV